MSFPSITNNQEFFSDHYLEAIIANDLKGLRSDWDAREQRDERTPRRGVRALRTPFGKLKQDAETATVIRGLESLQGLHDAILAALGFDPARHTIETARGEVVPVALPVAHATTLPTGLRLVAIEAVYAVSPDEALGPDSKLIEPLMLDGSEITEPTKAISLAFTVDDPPRHVLLVAGATLVLCARDSWPEGRYLAVDLDLALGRNDTKAQGELETIAALFSCDALVPGETGEAIIDELGASSLKQAVGVSADLREGVRRSVEDVANEIVTQRLAKNLRVYNEPDMARRLSRESLRFLYRILFLLYAEARPDLGIVPTLGEGYRDGYGLDRLREIALTELTTDHSINGTHLHDSLDILFDLVNDGYHHEFAQQQFTESGDAIDDTGLIFEPLHSELFGPNATPLLDSIRLRNEIVQRILARLLLTQEKGGRDRRFVSYATLGINQLGAVYEGLMAYTGFLADEDLHEVRKPGSEEKHGTWVVPVAKADQYDDEVFVTEVGEDGIPRRITHKKGSFVYRLSGRDRQRSASYYTPEVLTRCVVKHALKELLDQDGETTSADALLNLTICEPALGSGAFLNEAINQLSAEYLARKQTELEDTIDPEKYAGELQKVKTHFALHQSYGVDLNATAVELAEVSLWLNAMHPGLQAPWFGLHLRRGNSLIGARRAVYQAQQLVGRKWLDADPEGRALGAASLDSGEVHHFLLPASGWGAVRGAQDPRQLHPTAVEALKKWHKTVTGALSKPDSVRYVALARRVEALWQLATARLTLAERDLRRSLSLYPGSAANTGSALMTRAALEAALGGANTPLARLRLVMNAWCAMWFWPLDPPGQIAPPTNERWLAALEGLLGVDPADRPAAEPAQIDLFADLDALEAHEAELAGGLLMPPVETVMQHHPWLEVLDRIAARQGFFHWQLEFAPVFARGGFDLQVGNPPWTKLGRTDTDVLTDAEPHWGLHGTPTGAEYLRQLREIASGADVRSLLFEEAAASEAIGTWLGGTAAYPRTSALMTNLYLKFMERTWVNSRSTGVIGLLHPDGHYTDPKGKKLRRESYIRLRRRWHFVNEAKLFEDVHNQTDFAVHVYGRPRHIAFWMLCNAQLPDTVDESLEHDGSGPVPGIKTVDGAWDRRPHAARVITVDEQVLASWARLFDAPGTSPEEAQLVRPHAQQDVGVIGVLAASDVRLGDVGYTWTAGLHERTSVINGEIERRTAVPSSWDEVILQGPHFAVATPFAKQPNEGCKSNKDYSGWDLEVLPLDAIPRTNYATPAGKAPLKVLLRDTEPDLASYRLIYRRMAGTGGVRSLQCALIPPGPTHVHTCHTLAMGTNRDTVLASGLWSSLPQDFLFKVSGKGDVQDDLVERFPWPSPSDPLQAVLLRTLRLSCLTDAYASLWEEQFDRAWFVDDAWTTDDRRLGDMSVPVARWSTAVPLRTPLRRRHALVELDALGALVFGMTPEELCSVYRTTFGVLRKYEHAMRHDQNGREVPKEVWTAYAEDPEDTDLGLHVPPFTKPDREAEMRQAYAVFAKRYGGGVS
ncbi:MAG: restriction endonuclease subunit M [Solirubrobacteraceae bacterium]